MDALCAREERPSWWRRAGRALPLVVLGTALVSTVAVESAATTLWWLLGLLGLFAWSRNRRAWSVDPLLRWQAWACAGLLLFFVVNLMQADDSYSHIRSFEKFLRWAILAVAVGAFIGRVQHLRAWLVTAAVLALLVAGAYGGWQKVNEVFWHDRVGGVVHYIFFGNLTMTLALICGLVGLSLRRWWLAGLLLVCCLAGMAVSMLSNTRSSLVALVAVGLLAPFLLRRQPRIWQWLLAPAILAIALIIGYQAMPQVKTRIDKVEREIVAWSENDNRDARLSSVGVRLSLWQHCLTLWSQEPVLGIGIGDYRHEMRAVAQWQPHDRENGFLWQHHAHSVFFHLLATTGLVGVTLVSLALFILPGLQFWRILRRVDDPRRRFPAVAGMTVVISFACYGLTETWVMISAFASAYLTLLAPLLAAAHEEWLAVQESASQPHRVTVAETSVLQPAAPTALPAEPCPVM